MSETSVVRQLPLERWARRFRGGTVHLRGRVQPGGVTVVLCAQGRSLSLGAGDVAVVLRFQGGDSPAISGATITGSMGSLTGPDRSWSGHAFGLRPDSVSVDGVPTPDLGPIDVARALQSLLDAVGSLVFEASAEPAAELIVRLPAGLVVALDADERLVVRGASDGPPGALRLSQPLEVRCRGEGIRLSHMQLRMLAGLARVRIQAATLHPDGKVNLEGGAAGGIDRAVRGGLHHTSARLSRLVQTSPQFHKLRGFLKE